MRSLSTLVTLAFVSGAALGAESTSQNLRRANNQENIQCTTLRKHIQYESGALEHIWECEMLDSNGDILALDGLDELDNPEIMKEFESGVSIITIRGGIVDESSIQIPPGANILIDNRNSISQRRLNQNSTDNFWMDGHRKLVEGTRRVLAIRVIDVDGVSTTSSAYEMNDKIFGSKGNNLVSQYKACSYGKLNFAPTRALKEGDPLLTTAGVYEVRIPVRVQGMTESQVRTEVTNQLRKDFAVTGLPRGYKNFHTDASSPFDHVMYCLPPGTSGGWLASGYENSWLTTFNDRWCNFLSAQMHEISHNLNNHHSGDALATSALAQKYGDQSGYMGSLYGEENGPLMCFNAAKSWQLGWYDDKAVIVSPSSSSWSGRLMGISDYSNTSTQTVLLKLETGMDEDYYINFNRKSGINRDVREGADQVLVVMQGKNGIGYSESQQVARLSSRGSYEIPNFGGSGRSVKIKSGSINTSTSPGYADVTVEMGCTSDSHCERHVMFACSSFCNRNTNTCEMKAGCNCDYTCNAGIEDIFECPSDCLDPQTLETSITNNGVHAGNMFDIQAKKEVQITNFEINVQSEGKYVNAYVYTKVGGYSGFESVANAWRLLQTVRVKSEGGNKLTKLPNLSNPIAIPAGHRQSFYITLESNDMVFTGGQSSGALFASDDNVEFFVGSGVMFPFAAGGLPQRIFNGRIKYVEVAPVGVTTLSGVATGQNDVRPLVQEPFVAIKPPAMSAEKKKVKKESMNGIRQRRPRRRWRRFRRGSLLRQV